MVHVDLKEIVDEFACEERHHVIKRGVCPRKLITVDNYKKLYDSTLLKKKKTEPYQCDKCLHKENLIPNKLNIKRE